MAKMSLSLLAVAVLVLLASAAAETLNPSGRCQQQRRPESCRQYLRDGSRFSRTAGGGDWREAFPQCCEELEQIDRQCRCQAVKQVVRELQQVGELHGEESREMLQTAQSLPSLCRISPHYCRNIGQITHVY